MQNQPLLINGYWTLEGKRFSDMDHFEQIQFQESFKDLLFSHGCNKYTFEYWTRIGDDKERDVISVIATSLEQAEYLVKQLSKFIFKTKLISINGKNQQTDSNN